MRIGPACTARLAAAAIAVVALAGCGGPATPPTTAAAEASQLAAERTPTTAAAVVAASRAWLEAQLVQCAHDGEVGVSYEQLGCGIARNPRITDLQQELGGRDGTGLYNQVHYALDPSVGIGDPDATQAAIGKVTWTVGVDLGHAYAVDSDGKTVVQPFEPGASQWTVSTCSPNRAADPAAPPANCDPLSD